MEHQGKVALLVGGGPAPGINGVIGAATIEAIESGLEVVGCYDGFRWLVRPPEKFDPQQALCPLSIEQVSRIHFDGGSILRTSRTSLLPEDLKEDEPVRPDKAKVANVLANLRNLGVNFLITIGGDDTALSARFVAEAAKEQGVPMRVVHVPKTIDNDLPLPGDMPTFGFETARHVGAQLVHNLMEDSRTTSRWYIVVAMGRSAGHLALGITRATGATLAIIPEEFPQPVTLDHVAAIIEGAMLKRRVQGREHGVAIVAEGVAYKLQDIEYIENIMGRPIPRDDFGHPRLGEVPLADVLRDAVVARCKQRGEKVTLVAVNIGYELRCSPPIAFDVAYTRDLGYAAVVTLLSDDLYQEPGVLVTVVGGEIRPIPFGELADETGRTRVRRVEIDSTLYRATREYMIRLEREDLEDEAKVAALARAAKLTVEEFRQRFAAVVA